MSQTFQKTPGKGCYLKNTSLYIGCLPFKYSPGETVMIARYGEFSLKISRFINFQNTLVMTLLGLGVVK